MEYTITKKRIKNFIIRIYPDKTIKISVPIRATSKEIENFIFSKKDWIDKTLKKIEIKKVEENKNKNSINLLGKIYKKNIILSQKNKIELDNEIINIFILKKDKIYIENFLLEYKFNILSEIIEKYIEKYSKLLNKKITFYKIKKLKATWGIYHKKQNYISFNFDLIHKEDKFIEYVVLHEMCHIFHMNHQKEFWNLVGRYMPNYKEIRKK